MSDSQRKKRLPLHTDVRINGLYPAEGLDLSEDGIYVYTRHTFLPESLIELAVIVDGEKVELSGKVVHMQPGIGFGVQFPEMGKKAEDVFHRAIEHFRSTKA